MCSIDSDLLLHPELLATDTLIQVLSERRIKLEGLGTMKRDRLLELFNQYCLPHAQRKARDKHGRSNGSCLDKSHALASHPSDSEYFLSSRLSDTSLCDRATKAKSVEEDSRLTKKLKFSAPDYNSTYNDDIRGIHNNKRKILDQNDSNASEVRNKKQRLKITWP